MRAIAGHANQSRSGDRGSARLKRDANGVQMNELGVRGQVQEFHSLRQPQQRRRCKQHRVRHGHDGADRAAIIGLAVGIVVGGRRVAAGWRPAPSSWHAGLDRGRCVRDPVEMPERQHKLDRQRQQREPRPLFDVRAEPLHADMHPTSEGRGVPAVQCYIITSGMTGGCQPWFGCAAAGKLPACVVRATLAPATTLSAPRAARSRRTRRAAATGRSGRRTPAARRRP